MGDYCGLIPGFKSKSRSRGRLIWRFDDLEAPVKAPFYARTSIYTLLRAALKIDIYIEVTERKHSKRKKKKRKRERERDSKES